MDDDKLYLDIIPRIRVYEKKLIDNVKCSRMVDADSLDYAFNILSETTYGENILKDINVFNYERILSAEFEKMFKSINDILNDKYLIDIFLKKYKYNNIKLMIKSKFFGTDVEESLFNIEGIDNEFVYNCIKTENISLIDESISRMIKKVFKNFEENENIQMIDIIIDKEMFRELLEDARKIRNDFLYRYVQILIDTFNVKTLFRIKKLNLSKTLFDEAVVFGGNIPISVFRVCFSEPKENVLNRFSVTSIYKYIKEGIEHYVNNDELSYLDKELDDYIMKYLKNAKIITTGLAPIVGYVNAKETEIKNIRIIFVGKINGVDSDSIKRRLRESYV